MSTSSREAGFTLPEALIAGTLAIALVLPGFHLLQAAYGLVSAARDVALTNAAARQTFTLLSDGTSVSSNVEVNSAAPQSGRGFAIVEGLHSRQAVPTGSSLRSNSQFTLGDGALTATGDTMSPITIQCTGPATPIPDCTALENLVQIAGWIGADPVVTAPSSQIGAGRTAAISVTITNPFEAQRATGAAGATERYRMMFNLNPESSW